MHALQDLEHVRLSEALVCFPRGKDLEIVYSTKPSDVGLVLGLDESICGRAVRERKTIVLGDVSQEPEYRRLFGPSIKSEIAVPIFLGDDNVVIGVLNLESEQLDAFQGFTQVILERFAERVKVLLAFARLRANLTDTLESRHANDLLVAIGDQTSNLIHRLNNTVGALRIKLLKLQELSQAGLLANEGNVMLDRALGELLELAERTLEMPDQVTKFLGQQEGSAVDVNKCVILCLRELNPPASIIVDTQLASDLPELSLYSFDIVVQNLLKNAVDAMPSGGHVYVSTKKVSYPGLPAGYVQLTVRDTGCGIPDEILPNIFRLNFTTKRSKGKGLGLGLWWVRTFVLRSGGEISVSTEPGAGSEFTIQIPIDLSVVDSHAGESSASE